MNADRWVQVRALLQRALEIPIEQRSQFVEQQAADLALAAEVYRLLAFEREADGIFSVESWKLAGTDLGTGTTLGSYRILEELGRGGMGAVYLAERADGVYQQQVAVKILQEGIFTPALAERFGQERQLLARLQHPGIARLLDGGVTSSGRPYLVLEYVAGEPIDVFCEVNGLDVRARLQLFLRVAQAVQSAHQQLVLHLDLKPANILVTAEGDPRLLDFGIARLLTEAGDGASQTEATLRLLTPRYASPEQASGAPLGVASDVFSLATLLYRMLTGKLPYPIEDASPFEAARIIRESAPALPSRLAPSNIASELRGDIDTILLYALRKEPERRYPTVAAFADDIQRHLDSNPVHAHVDTFSYRATKFVRRNRVAVAAGVLAATVLIVSGVAVAHSAVVARRERANADKERIAAERRLNDVRSLAHSYIYELMPALQNIPGTLAVRDKMATTAIGYLQAMSKERGNDPTLDAEIASGYYYIGKTQGNPFTPNLGKWSQAMTAFEGALTIEKRAAARDPKDLGAPGRIVVLLTSMANVREAQGDIPAAMDLLQQAWTEAQLVIAGPWTPRLGQIANSAYYRSMDYSHDGVWSMADPEAALNWINQSDLIVQRLLDGKPELRQVPGRLSQMVYVQLIKAGRLIQLGREAEAKAIYKKYLPVMDTTDPKDDRPFLYTRRWIHVDYAQYLFRHGDLAGAIQMSTLIRPEQKREKSEAGTEDLFNRIELADEYGWAAVLDLSSGKTAKGQQEMRQCLESYRQMRQGAPDLMWTTTGLVKNELMLAELPQVSAKDANEMLEEAALLTHSYAMSQPTVLSAQVDEAHARVGLAKLAQRAHHPAEQKAEAEKARRLLERVCAVRPKLISAHTLLISAHELEKV
jgi:tetratricopeptide (TPR) repeat protein